MNKYQGPQQDSAPVAQVAPTQEYVLDWLSSCPVSSLSPQCFLGSAPSSPPTPPPPVKEIFASRSMFWIQFGGKGKLRRLPLWKCPY